MTEKVELKPCPFCGKEPTRRNSVQLLPTKPDDYVYCETETCPIERKPISIPEWNTRAAASAQPATARIIEINEGDSEEGEYPYLEFEVEAEVVDPPKTPATRESTGADQNADQTKSNNAD